MTPVEMLSHLLRDAETVAIGVPHDGTPPRFWFPSQTDANEHADLIQQHRDGTIDPRLAAKGRGGHQRQELERQAVWLGIYTIIRDDDGKPWAWWLALDTDVKAEGHKRGLTQEQADALADIIVRIMTEAGLCPIKERSHSGRGWHVWALFSERIPGPMAEWLASLIATAAASAAGLSDGAKPEAFPKCGDPPTLGNLVAAPLTGAPRGPGGGQIINATIDLVPPSVIAEWKRQWIDALAATERLKREQELAAEVRRDRWKASGKAPRIDFDRVTCETVARALAPERITSSDDGDLYLDCPRHASSSRRSLTVSRSDGGWWCFGCAKGGGSLLLARWLMPDATEFREICKALEGVTGAA